MEKTGKKKENPKMSKSNGAENKIMNLLAVYKMKLSIEIGRRCPVIPSVTLRLCLTAHSAPWELCIWSTYC